MPQAPHTPCTETAPTGSSILMRSKNSTANTTMTPAMAPMITAPQLLTLAHPAVIPTRPASTPLPVIATSGLPLTSQIVSMLATAPAAAASTVVTAIDVTTTSAASCDPGLNPNQPTSRMNTPMMANGTEWPGIARGFPSGPYLPMRGPRISAPISAAHTTDAVHDRRTGEVDEWRVELREPAAAPEPVHDHRVDQRGDERPSR